MQALRQSTENIQVATIADCLNRPYYVLGAGDAKKS